jgi:hypothetical protein
MFHTHFHLHVAFTSRTTGEGCELSKKQYPFGKQGTLDRNVLSRYKALNGQVRHKQNQRVSPLA